MGGGATVDKEPHIKSEAVKQTSHSNALQGL